MESKLEKILKKNLLVNQNNVYIIKMIEDAGLEDEVKKINTIPLHLGPFVLSNSKRIMNLVIHAINEFCPNDV